MMMLTIRLRDNPSDPIHTSKVQVPVGALTQQGLLRDAPTSSTVELHPAVTFKVPTGATELEERTFVIVKDGQEVGNADQYHLIGSYFTETNQSHARHVFELSSPSN